MSFATIGAIWVGHVTMTEFLAAVSQGLLRLNLESLASVENERVAVTLYGVVIWAIALVLSVLWRYALRGDLIRSDRNSEDMRLLTRRLTPSLGFYLVVILIGFFFPTAAVFGYLLIAIGLLVPTGIRPPVSKTTAAS